MEAEWRHGFITTHQSYYKLERIAARVRKALLPTIADDEAVPGVQLFENLDDLEINLGDRVVSIDYAVNPLPAGLEGLTVFDEHHQEVVIVLSPKTYHALVAGDPRALFCLCHELGHACVHTRMLINLSRIPHRMAALHRGEIPRHRAFEDTEWQANGFSAAFIMPAAGLIQLERQFKVLTPEIAKMQFNASFEAARVRTDIFRSRRRELLK